MCVCLGFVSVCTLGCAGPVAARVFPFAELRLLSVERLLFWSAGSGFSACSSWVLERWLHSCADAQLLHGLWDLPGPGTEPVSSSLAGGVFTTELPGSPGVCLLKDTVCNHSWPALLPAGVRTRSPAILRSDRQCSSANPITRVTSGSVSVDERSSFLEFCTYMTSDGRQNVVNLTLWVLGSCISL